MLLAWDIPGRRCEESTASKYMHALKVVSSQFYFIIMSLDVSCSLSYLARPSEDISIELYLTTV